MQTQQLSALSTAIPAEIPYAEKGSQIAILSRSGTPPRSSVDALAEPTLERVIRALFGNTVAFLTTPGQPPTCMTLAGAMGCSVDAAPARDLMTEIRRQNEVAIKKRLQQARTAGELPKEIHIDDYTRYLSTLLAGLSIQAANGSTRGELKRTARMALKHLGY